jgi:hypothetical protein
VYSCSGKKKKSRQVSTCRIGPFPFKSRKEEKGIRRGMRKRLKRKIWRSTKKKVGAKEGKTCEGVQENEEKEIDAGGIREKKWTGGENERRN